MISIHLATLLFGLAGLFGKWVALPAQVIVFGRVLFAALFLLPLIAATGQKARLENRFDGGWLALQGALLALHWGSFFKAIQVSSVAVGLLTFASFPVFTALLEPLFEKRPFVWKSLAPAMATLWGVYLVVPDFSASDAVFQGALWGLVSGLTFALLSLYNRRFVRRYSGAVIALWQDGFAMLFLLPFVIPSLPQVTLSDVGLLVLLGTLFTGVSHTLFINGMKRISARRASIVVSLEPVYGIAAAMLLLGEVPDFRAMAGGAIILATALFVTLEGRRKGS